MFFKKNTVQKIFFVVFYIFLFSGCGEIEFPESIEVPQKENSQIKEPQKLKKTTETNVENIQDVSISLENFSQEYKKIKAERDNLKEAIKISQEELKTCTLQKEKLESSLLTQNKSSSIDIKKFVPFVDKYLKEVKQREYPFNPTVCGGIGKATSQGWYPDFVVQLEKSGIQFAPLKRALKPDDFGGVCASDEGKIAIFLGASYKGKNDFHLIKYDIESKTLEEAIFIDGECDICPSSFGKRFGPLITLNGKSGSKTKQYEYYYDANILKMKK